MEHLSRRQKSIVNTPGIPKRDTSESEEIILRHINRYFSLLLLGTALAAPAATMAAPKPQEASVQVRVYDRDHRDYQNWDDREDRAYRRYLVVEHRGYRKYERQNYRVHRHYWQWRHNHPDND